MTPQALQHEFGSDEAIAQAMAESTFNGHIDPDLLLAVNRHRPAAWRLYQNMLTMEMDACMQRILTAYRNLRSAEREMKARRLVALPRTAWAADECDRIAARPSVRSSRGPGIWATIKRLCGRRGA